MVNDSVAMNTDWNKEILTASGDAVRIIYVFVLLPFYRIKSIEEPAGLLLRLRKIIYGRTCVEGACDPGDGAPAGVTHPWGQLVK
jgi:hypothetical protein